MKLRYIIAAIASAAIFAGCQTEPMVGSFEDFSTNTSYISIPVAGGSQEVNLTAPEAWSFAKLFDLKDEDGKVVKDENDKNVKTELPDWLTADKVSGSGSTTIKFSAEASESGREAELQIKCGSKTLFLVVRQGSVEAVEASCKEVIDGPDGKSYIVKGTVTSIVNPTYGNWYLKDDAGDEVYIYGTLDKDGKTKNFLSLGLEVGDVVKVSGPKTTYGETVELVDVTVLSIEKALLSIVKVDPAEVSKDGGDLEIVVAFKGKGVYQSIEDEYNWITYKNSEFKAGVPTLFEKNPADTVVFNFSVAAFDGYKPRSGFITLSSSAYDSDKNKTNTTVMDIEIKQKSNAPDVKPIMDAIADGFAHVEGTVMAICKRGYVLADDSGAVLAYYGSAFKPENYKLGDKIGIVDEFGAYNFGLQFSCDGKDGFVLEDKLKEGSGSVTYPEPEVIDPEKLAAIIASIDGKDKTKPIDAIATKYVEITGTPKKSGSYTNIYLDNYEDADFSAYQLPEQFDLESKIDKKVVIRGYVQSVSGGKHVNIVFTSLEDAQ